jgi:hypothetical protein
MVDSIGRGGDAGTLLRNGAVQWELWLFGLAATPIGFWLWHGLGPYFGLGAANGEVSRGAAIVSASLLALAVVLELVFYPLHRP